MFYLTHGGAAHTILKTVILPLKIILWSLHKKQQDQKWCSLIRKNPKIPISKAKSFQQAQRSDQTQVIPQ